MQDLTGLGFSSASSEFQEKMRLGDTCRLGFALLSFCGVLALLRALHRCGQWSP